MSMLLPQGGEILPEHPDTCSGPGIAIHNAPVWRHEALGSLHAVMGMNTVLFSGRSPPWGTALAAPGD